MIEPDLVVIHTFMNRPEAELAKSALGAAGIEARVFGDDAGGVQPGLWEGRGVADVVSVEDEQAAREILDTAAKPSE